MTRPYARQSPFCTLGYSMRGSSSSGPAAGECERNAANLSLVWTTSAASNGFESFVAVAVVGETS